MKFTSLTLRERLDRFPPFIVYNLSRIRTAALSPEEKSQRWSRAARKERRRRNRKLPRKPLYRRMTQEEVVARSGLSSYTVDHLTGETTWQHQSIFTMLHFMEACGFDLLHLNQTWRRFSNSKAFSHLTKLESVEFAKRLKELSFKERCG